MKTYSGIIKLICLLVISPLIIWLFALKETYQLYNEKRKIQSENQSFSLIASKKQEQSASLISSKPLLSNGKILQVFENNLSDLEIEVANYIPELIDSEGEHKLYMSKIILTGQYINLVKMISIIEHANFPLKIISLNFSYDRNKRKPDYSISLAIILEQIEY